MDRLIREETVSPNTGHQGALRTKIQHGRHRHWRSDDIPGRRIWMDTVKMAAYSKEFW